MTAPTAAPAIGPYSPALRVGNLLFLSGQIPLDPATGHLITGDIRAQTTRVLENIGALLSAAGIDFAQVARTTIADHWRSVYHLRANSLDDLLDTGLELPAEEQARPDTGATDRRVERILAQLPERYRDVLTYRFLRNYSIKETAVALGISEANVKVIQFRALKKASESSLDRDTR